MTTHVEVVSGEDEVEAFFEALSLGPDEREVANTSFWQLADFEFERVVCFTGDVHLARGEHMFSKAWLEAHGVDMSDDAKTLVVVEGNVIAEGSVSLSEDYAIVRGDVSAERLYVDGEALFVCFGTVTARYIESTYNGVISCIRRGKAEFVFLSTDDVLQILEVEPGAMVLQYYESDIVEGLFVEDMLDDGAPSRACREAIARGDAVLRIDVQEILRQVHRLGTDVRGASEELAGIAGIADFRFWDGDRADATVLHALARIDAPQDVMQTCIATLIAAGVPLEQEGRKPRFKTGVGTALHVAIVSGLESTAAAFVAEGASVDAGGGRLMKLILEPLEYMAKYPDRSSAEEKVELVRRSKAAMSIAKTLGYRPIGELESLGKRHSGAIEAAAAKGTHRAR